MYSIIFILIYFTINMDKIKRYLKNLIKLFKMEEKMKIIDQKGRLFGFINVVDFTVLLAVIFAIGAVCVTLFAPTIKEVTSPSVNMTAVFRIRGASEYLQAQIENNPLEGEEFISGNDYIGVFIKSVETAPYEYQVTLDSGEVITTCDPTKLDYIITVETPVSKGTAVPKIGSQEVRAGRTFIIKTQEFETNSLIVSVDIDD